MRSAITVSLVPEAAGGPFVFWDGIDRAAAAAAELGFDALEIFPPEPGGFDKEALRRTLQEKRLALAALGTGAGWVKHKLQLTAADAAVRQRARAFAAGIIDDAAEFGAPAIIGSMQGRVEAGGSRAQTLGWLREALEELGERAAARGQILLIEPLNRYETNVLNTVAQGLELLSSLATPGVRLLLDLFHMNIEEQDIAASIRAAGTRIGHVHFVDSNRRAAGFGHIDLGAAIAALRETGYRGYLSAEALPSPDSPQTARQTIEKFRELLGRP